MKPAAIFKSGTILRSAIVLFTLLAAGTVCAATPAWARLDKGSLEKRVSACAKSFKGQLGVGVIDLKSGESWFHNGDEHFRMQSVAKLPVAIGILQQVDAGKLTLDEEVSLTKGEVVEIRNSAIPDPLSPKAKSASISSLLERSMLRSNNGAVDAQMRILGGPKAINKVFDDAHISGIRVDRYEIEVCKEDDANKGAALLDSATPKAACELLSKLNEGKLLSAKSTAYLLDLMRRCQTGDDRIRAGFPKDWGVADKTGTGRQAKGICVSTNDVAIITAPDKSSLVLAVFVADAKLDRAACEAKIAEVAKALFESSRQLAQK